MSMTRPEIISVSDWGDRVGVSRASAYRAASRSEIPGMFKVGRLLRINWEAFVRSTDIDVAHERPEAAGAMPRGRA